MMNNPTHEPTLHSTITALQRVGRGEAAEIANFPAIEQAIKMATLLQLPLLHAIVAAGLEASIATVDTLLSRKRISPQQFLTDLKGAGQITLGSLLSMGAKVREFQADLPDLTRGATSFLIVRAARARIAELSGSELGNAQLPSVR